MLNNAWKVPVFEVILIDIFLHSHWILRFSLSLSLSPYSGSGGMRGGNADQNISKYRHFLRSSLFTYIFRGSTHQLNKNNILFYKETLFPSIKDLKLLIIARKCIAWILRLGNCLRLQYFLLVVTDPRVCIKKPLLVESAVQLIALPWSYLKSNNIKAQAKTSNVKKQFYLWLISIIKLSIQNFLIHS